MGIEHKGLRELFSLAIPSIWVDVNFSRKKYGWANFFGGMEQAYSYAVTVLEGKVSRGNLAH
jgi:hypothetical protein